MNNYEVKIGVVVAVYNTEKWLDECLESLVNQSKSFFEIVLVDDGSTDGSLAVCEKFRDRYPNIKVYHQANGKQGKARNNGIAHISSEYLLFVDSDDLLEPDTVAILSSIISKKRYDAVYFEARVFGKKELMQFCYNRTLETETTEETGVKFFSQCYPRSYFKSACLAVYKTELIRSAGIYFPEGVFYEDNYFTFVFMQVARSVCCIPDILYGRRIREESTMTSRMTADKVHDFCDVVLSIYQYIRLHRKEIKDGIDAVQQYVCDLCLSVLIKYDQYREDAGEYDYGYFDKINLVFKFYCQLSKELNDDFQRWSLSCAVTEHRILSHKYFSEDTEIAQRKEENHRVMLEKYCELLRELPLDDEMAKVGIYGIGRHTEGLLKAYNTLIGNIRARLVFFETNGANNKWGEKHNYPVKSYLEIDETYDVVIISSYIYQQDMKKNALSVYRGCKLVCFYGEAVRRDVFSGIDGLL